MKKYQPKTDYYRHLLAACSEELRLLGYAVGTAKLGGAGEFLQRMEQLGKVRLDQIEKADMTTYLKYLQSRPTGEGGSLSPYTIEGYVFSLRLLFDYGERHGLRGGNPLAGLRLPARPKSERYVATRAEIAALYGAASEHPRLTALLHLLYGCGLRRMEAERINLGDIDYRAALLYVRRGKGRKRRVIPLSEGVARGLKHYQKKDRWRWVSAYSGKAYLLDDKGSRMRGATMGRRLAELVRKAKVSKRITPHGLRHAIATHLLAGGMNVEQVRDFLGHIHLETTQVYTKIKTEAL
ncbi:MAG: tyrosine-type recombinase/integrase [Bacteroidota bacterium]